MASKYLFRALQSCSRDRPLQSSILKVQSRCQSSDSTAAAAMNYKALHRRRSSPLPVSPAKPMTAAAAVTNILYETPVASTAPTRRNVLNCLVQNEPGVLSRISGTLAARGFNIDSLVVCSTEVPDLSRMTIVLKGQDGVLEQARRQLEDLVPVWAVLNYTNLPLVQRELLLAKVCILGPEYFDDLMVQYGMSENIAEEISEDSKAHLTSAEDHKVLDPTTSSEALQMKYQHLQTITALTKEFGGKVLDISTTNCILELSAKPSRIDNFMKLISPYGIIESTRTGLMALPRSPLEDTNEIAEEIKEEIDLSTLPPS